MNEKVVVLFILGMGAVRLCKITYLMLIFCLDEDYVDEIDRDDDDEEDRFKKRKISRRDISDEPLPPANAFETVVEVQQDKYIKNHMATCNNIGPKTCSCEYVFICFYS